MDRHGALEQPRSEVRQILAPHRPLMGAAAFDPDMPNARLFEVVVRSLDSVVETVLGPDSKHGDVIVCATTAGLRARLRTAPIRSRERQRADAQLLMTFCLGTVWSWSLSDAPQRGALENLFTRKLR